MDIPTSRSSVQHHKRAFTPWPSCKSNAQLRRSKTLYMYIFFSHADRDLDDPSEPMWPFYWLRSELYLVLLVTPPPPSHPSMRLCGLFLSQTLRANWNANISRIRYHSEASKGDMYNSRHVQQVKTWIACVTIWMIKHGTQIASKCVRVRNIPADKFIWPNSISRNA